MDKHLIQCAKLMTEKGLTIAFVESATGGRVTSDFSLVPHAGKFLKGGLVCYDAKLKETILNVPKRLIDEKTPESMEVTEAIAESLTRLIEADIHVGITGLTSSGGSETAEKPVGTMFIHGLINNNHRLFSRRILFSGSPEDIVKQTTVEVARLLNEFL